MVKIDKLNKSYDDNIIYKDTTYSFKEKALTCFYGESGSGKTTLFNILAAFDTDFKGDVEVNGIKLNTLNKSELPLYRGENIGFIFQNYNLLKGYTALENVLMALYPTSNLSESEKNNKALELLAKLNLEEEVNQKIETLSGGQKQRISIARALINNPSIILADEPTGALDIENTKGIMRILKDIAKDKTVIVITHDEELLKYADEVIALENNNIKRVKGYDNEGNESIVESRCIKEEATLSNKVSLRLALKNFSINKFKYILTIIMLAVSVSTFIASLSLKDINTQVMVEFQNKNTHYKVGQVEDFSRKNINDVYESLIEMDGIENVYLQGNIKDTILKYEDKVLDLRLNSPAIISMETLAYGKMPSNSENEIAISSSVASMLNIDIRELVGEALELQYKDSSNIIKSIKVKIVGITNNKKQNFILSSNIEKEIYTEKEMLEEDFKIVRFEVKDFDNILEVNNKLQDMGITAEIKSEEVKAVKETFSNLIKLFTVLAYLIFIVGIVISSIVLYKVLSHRKTEIATLGAIGYKDKDVTGIIVKEGIVLSAITIILSASLILIMNIIAKSSLGYSLSINIVKIIGLIGIVVAVYVGGALYFCKNILKRDKSLLLK